MLLRDLRYISRPLDSLLSWRCPLPSSPLSSNPELPGLLSRLLLQLLSPTCNPVQASPNKVCCVLLPLMVISFTDIKHLKSSQSYRTATSWAETARVDPRTHIQQEQWPLITGQGSGAGPRPLCWEGLEVRNKTAWSNGNWKCTLENFPQHLDLNFVHGVKPRFNSSGFLNILAEVATPSIR